MSFVFVAVNAEPDDDSVDATPTVSTGNSTGDGKCSCETQKEQKDGPVSSSAAKETEYAEFRYHFENYLQNKAFVKK